MLTFLLTAALSGLLVGIATNQVTRILRLGTIFERLRMELSFQARIQHNRTAKIANDLLECHLCLGTHVATVLVVLGAIIAIVTGVEAPLMVWVFGPPLAAFIAGGIDQMIETAREATQ